MLYRHVDLFPVNFPSNAKLSRLLSVSLLTLIKTLSRIDNLKTLMNIQTRLKRIYGNDSLLFDLNTLLNNFAKKPSSTSGITEQDAILITYGNMITQAGELPLVTLHTFLKETLQSIFNSVHILPFYPYTSDDGFSVVDYYAVNADLGDWGHIKALSKDFNLMFDAVFNHISTKSNWFQAFLRDEEPYIDYFTVVDPESDLSEVVRPRALPLLTPFETLSGTKYVWTTFSADQVDLNYTSPDLLLDVIRVLLFYVEQGAKLIRLDAIAFIWKEIGTSCIHLENTHLLIQLMRDVLDRIAPDVILITETNVPHQENISYFGDGTNEAQMVYNFALPPLAYHTMLTGDTTKLSKWASQLERVGDKTTYFNFTASHDGIGLRPVADILSQEEIKQLVQTTEKHGGLVSYRSMSDGTQSPYELNITYFDAITAPEITLESPELAVKRFMVSQAIAMSLIGVPGIYFHSVFGSRNNHAGVEKTKHNRTINREKLQYTDLKSLLADEASIPSQVYRVYTQLLEIRTNEPAFHPFGEQKILNLTSDVFAVERISPDKEHKVLALHNVTDHQVILNLTGNWHDLVGKNTLDTIVLEPFQIRWLKVQFV